MTQPPGFSQLTHNPAIAGTAYETGNWMPDIRTSGEYIGGVIFRKETSTYNLGRA